jgi:hypothetical protein
LAQVVQVEHQIRKQMELKVELQPSFLYQQKVVVLGQEDNLTQTVPEGLAVQVVVVVIRLRVLLLLVALELLVKVTLAVTAAYLILGALVVRGVAQVVREQMVERALVQEL